MSEPIEKKDFEKIQTEKAKIISVLAQHLYIMCTLSKDQIKNITAFWKAIIGFIFREHKQFVKIIKESFSTSTFSWQTNFSRTEITESGADVIIIEVVERSLLELIKGRAFSD